MAKYSVDCFVEVLKEDIPKAPTNIQNRIEHAISERLITYPEKYGERLRRSLLGLWKLRVGDYRVIYEMKGQRITVWMIGHRRDVYENIQKRRTKHRH